MSDLRWWAEENDDETTEAGDDTDAYLESYLDGMPMDDWPDKITLIEYAPAVDENGVEDEGDEDGMYWDTPPTGNKLVVNVKDWVIKNRPDWLEIPSLEDREWRRDWAELVKQVVDLRARWGITDGPTTPAEWRGRREKAEFMENYHASLMAKYLCRIFLNIIGHWGNHFMQAEADWYYWERELQTARAELRAWAEDAQ